MVGLKECEPKLNKYVDFEEVARNLEEQITNLIRHVYDIERNLRERINREIESRKRENKSDYDKLRKENAQLRKAIQDIIEYLRNRTKSGKNKEILNMIENSVW